MPRSSSIVAFLALAATGTLSAQQAPKTWSLRLATGISVPVIKPYNLNHWGTGFGVGAVVSRTVAAATTLGLEVDYSSFEWRQGQRVAQSGSAGQGFTLARGSASPMWEYFVVTRTAIPGVRAPGPYLVFGAGLVQPGVAPIGPGVRLGLGLNSGRWSMEGRWMHAFNIGGDDTFDARVVADPINVVVVQMGWRVI